MFVTLNQDQIDKADAIALMRQDHAEKTGARGRNGQSNEREIALQSHIEGMRAECAAAIALNPVKWNSFHTKVTADTPDLEDWIDVKGVTAPHHRLIVQKGSNPHWAFLLVDGTNHPTYQLVSWCWGRDAMQPENWDTPVRHRPAYVIRRDDQWVMRPIDLFVAELRSRQINPVIVPPRAKRRF